MAKRKRRSSKTIENRLWLIFMRHAETECGPARLTFERTNNRKDRNT